MPQRYDVYKCEACGNMVEVLHSGAGELVCCGKPMKHIVENTVDASKEKHVPVVEISNSEVHALVGSIEHPMEEKHLIEWIEVNSGDYLFRKYLKPGERPEAVFEVEGKVDFVREYCNMHGLWKKEQ